MIKRALCILLLALTLLGVCACKNGLTADEKTHDRESLEESLPESPDHRPDKSPTNSPPLSPILPMPTLPSENVTPDEPTRPEHPSPDKEK